MADTSIELGEFLLKLRLEAGQPAHATVARHIRFSVRTVIDTYKARAGTWTVVERMAKYLNASPEDMQKLRGMWLEANTGYAWKSSSRDPQAPQWARELVDETRRVRVCLEAVILALGMGEEGLRRIDSLISTLQIRREELANAVATGKSEVEGSEVENPKGSAVRAPGTGGRRRAAV